MACFRKSRRRGSEDTRAAAAVPRCVAGNVVCASKGGTSVKEPCFPSLVLYFSSWKNGNKHAKYVEQDYFLLSPRFFCQKTIKNYLTFYLLGKSNIHKLFWLLFCCLRSQQTNPGSV